MLIPKVRFPQYTDEWGNKPLLQLVLDMNGGAPLSPDDILDSGDYKIIPKKAIQAGGKIVIDDGCSYVTQDVYEKYKASHIDKSHTLVVLRDLVPTGPSIGYVVENDKVDEGILAQGVYGMHFKEELCPRYFIQYSNTPQYRKLMQTIMVGSTQVHIRNTTYLEIDIPFPSLPEQQLIADFLSTVDEVIATSQEEVANLEKQKKAAMQKIFSQEVRFKKPDGSDFPEWEEKKIGDIGTVKMCKRVFKEQTSSQGEIPFYKIGTFGGKADAFISRELYDELRNKYSFPQKGNILLSAAGTIGRAVVYDGEDAYFQDSNIVWLEHDDSITDEFLFQFYMSTTWTNLEGGTIDRLYNGILLEKNISVPHPDEQKLIADFFTSFDEAITAAKQELESWKLLKKGLLQKMFV